MFFYLGKVGSFVQKVVGVCEYGAFFSCGEVPGLFNFHVTMLQMTSEKNNGLKTGPFFSKGCLQL